MASAYRQWQVWKVHWQHEDGGAKDRPAILVSGPRLIEEESCVFMQISSQDHDVPFKIRLTDSDPVYHQMGLWRTPSFIYVRSLQVIPQNSILEYCGQVGVFMAMRLTQELKLAGEDFGF